jgi:hypothetical protein
MSSWLRAIAGAITVAGAVLLVGALAPISAQTTEDPKKRALGEVAGEMEVCSAYFYVVSTCLKPQEPRLASEYEAQHKQSFVLSSTLLQKYGVSDDAIVAQFENYTKALMTAIQFNCTNIAVLLQRYATFCQRLSQDPEPRVKEWLACSNARQRTCGGPGLPKLSD